MKYWLRGKWTALIGFLAIASLVTGGLGWATAAVLRLEREQSEARAEAELTGKLRIALWQLDSFILPDLSREDGRPFTDYIRTFGTGKGEEPGLTRAEVPAWVLFHFQADDKGWRSPQLAVSKVAPAPASAATPSRKDNKAIRQLIAELESQWKVKDLLARLRERRTQALVNDSPLVMAASATDSSTTQQAKQTDYGKRLNYQNQIRNDPYSKPVAVKLTRPMVPLWVRTAGGGDGLLLLMREAQIGPRRMVQGLVIDWARLQAVLAEQIADIFPKAQLVPIRDKATPNPERAMTALPVELMAGVASSSVPLHGWTPLRIGLAVAWTAIGIALLATCLGGWSLLDLSERRSRFVSAVTHELRTPLTTLRLYLDMLTSGMVREESQKAEYLATLHAEAERLNRLIGNVLDFSRLEKQRPRLDLRRTPVAELLEQARSTWQARCHDAGKELVVENSAANDAAVVTDGEVVLQIVGNLIDNACKYSREAADCWIRLGARLDGRQLTLQVEDRGPGIPPGERRHVFRPFRRGAGADVIAGGVGLGLALARRWAGLLGGRLTVQPGPGKIGCCFRLELPASASG
jgi:signal transduction histidine kinase